MNSDKHGGMSVVDPLIAPEPSDETGLNSHFRSTYAEKPSPRAARSSSSPRSPISPTSPPVTQNGTRQRRRGSSLSERYPGDMSHKPLDMIRKDSKRAHRSPHLKKQYIPGADQIDRLDPTLGASYHHEGPYDAALMSRNRSSKLSPVAALSDTNEEAIRATPRENLIDSIKRHRPLDGVAAIPPGQKDRWGRTYKYEEGSNMMVDNDPPGGQYKRWENIDYLPEDIKGKGEPTYSIEKALKNHKISGDPADEQGIEMQSLTRPMVSGIGHRDPEYYADTEFAAHQGKRSSLDGIKRRIGSLRRKKDRDPLE